jgi:hypothetical protein
MPGVHVLYAQTRDPADRTSLVGVERDHHRALIEIERPGLGAPTQLVRIDFAQGTLEEVWSPSQALSRTLEVGNALGPKLPDALDAGAAFQADLVGWAGRLATSGPPWADGVLATAPGAKHIVFVSSRYAWVTGPDGARPSMVGPAGRGVLSADGEGLAWAAVVDHMATPPVRLVVARLGGGGNPDAITGITNPRSITWSHDGKHVYVVARGEVDGSAAGGCLYAVDAMAHTSKMLACADGEKHGIAISPDDRFAVLTGYTPGTPHLSSDVTYVALPAGPVKRHVHVRLLTSGGILDDAGLFVMSDASFVAALDLSTGRQKIAKSPDGALQIGAWVGSRSLVALRTVEDRTMLERIDVDALVPVKPDELPPGP